MTREARAEADEGHSACAGDTKPMTPLRAVSLILVVALVALAVWSLCVGRALADAPDVKLELIPDAVEIPLQGQVETLVVVRNPLIETLRNVTLGWFGTAPVTVTLTPASSSDVPPGGMLTWTLHLARKGLEPPSSTLHLVLNYRVRTEQGEVQALTTSDLKFTLAKARTVQEVAHVRVESALSALMEPRKGIIYLVVTNISAVPIELASVTADEPAGVTTTFTDSHAIIAPGVAHVVTVECSVSGRITPGNELLLVKLDFEWAEGGDPQIGVVVVSHPLQIGIVGESEVLTLLGVPTILILPGVLILTALGALWRLAPRRDFPLPITDPGFWPVAVSLSVVAAAGYVVLGHSSYLQAYNLADLWWLWSSCLVTALALWVLYNLREQLGQWLATQYIPKAGDSEMQILGKLSGAIDTFVLPEADVEVDGQQQRVYLLQWKGMDTDKVWVAPPMRLSFEESAGGDWKTKVYAALDVDKPHIKGLVSLLQEAKGKAWFTLKWEQRGHVAEVCNLPAGQIRARHMGKQSIVIV